MPSCDFNCAALPSYVRVTCNDFDKGGISSIGVLDCDHAITDFTLAAQYTTEISGGNLTLIETVRAQMPVASPIENPNPSGCGPDTILDGFERTVTWVDSNVSAANVTFYNELNKRRFYLILYNCGSDVVRVIQTPVSFMATEVYPESDKARATWEVTAKWSSFDAPEYYAAPTGIFAS